MNNLEKKNNFNFNFNLSLPQFARLDIFPLHLLPQHLVGVLEKQNPQSTRGRQNKDFGQIYSFVDIINIHGMVLQSKSNGK